MRFTERHLQLLDLLEQLPLARVRPRLAVLGQPLLAVLQKQPLPVRNRLLRRLAAPSGLGHAHLTRDDCEHKPIFVFNRENRRTCH